MSWYNTLIPAGTLVIGACLSEVSSWLADRRRSGDAARISVLERARAREIRRETFELDLLVKLNEALLGFGRAWGHAHYIDTMTSKQTGVYAGTQLPEEASDALYAAGRQMLALMNMVLDDELRDMVRRAYDEMSAVSRMYKATVADADAAFYRAGLTHGNALEAIAARVRELYLNDTVIMDPDEGVRQPARQ
jgi:hypothetical protein